MTRLLVLPFALVAVAVGFLHADPEPTGKNTLALTPANKEYLTLEPILVAVAVHDKHFAGLPAVVGDAKAKTTLRFDIQPAVKPRAGAKPLPLEGKIGEATRRLVDLLEWYQFPAQGTFTVQAILESGAHKIVSDSTTIAIRQPDKKDTEWGPVDRLHHIPWSNYCTDQFCGDTFDVVKRWPDSRMSPYAHYYNGLFNQHKEDHDKAIASFEIVMKKHAKFVLAADAEWALRESQVALGKADDLGKQFSHWLAHNPQRSGKHAILIQQSQK